MGSCPGGRKTETRIPQEIVDGTKQPWGSLPVSVQSRQAVEGRVGGRDKGGSGRQSDHLHLRTPVKDLVY